MSENPQNTENQDCAPVDRIESVVTQIFDKLAKQGKPRRLVFARRSQEYYAKIDSGELIVIAGVVRDLYPRSRDTDDLYSGWKIYWVALEALAYRIASRTKYSENDARKAIEEYLRESSGLSETKSPSSQL